MFSDDLDVILCYGDTRTANSCNSLRFDIRSVFVDHPFIYFTTNFAIFMHFSSQCYRELVGRLAPIIIYL